MSGQASRVSLMADRVVTPTRDLAPGWVEVVGEQVAAVGAGRPPHVDESLTALPPGSIVVPGFVDQHVHGGGGADMTSGGAAAMRAAAGWHARRGTTSLLASLVTGPLPNLAAGLDAAADVASQAPVHRARVLGTHLEGPFLSVERRGAHRRCDLREVSRSAVSALLEAARGWLRMVTVAPERDPYALALRVFGDAGSVVAVGHTDATWERTLDYAAAGATVATHLFNGMRPIHHREPGPAVALLASPGVTCELINDGTHVHPAIARLARRAAGEGRLALISDAVSATGAPDGMYTLGDVAVASRDGVPHVPDGSSLAGGTVGLDAALRRAVDVLGLGLGEAVACVTSVPAAVLGVEDRVGSLEPGRCADLVVLDPELSVRAVMVAGSWVVAPADAS